jgi:predicted nucleic acid-binding protein
MSVFIDTAFFYARMSPRDQWHRLAKLAPLPPPGAVTTSLVVSETVSLMQGRGYVSSALEFLHAMRDQDEIEIIYPDAAMQAQARRIKQAYTFDTHFREAGFRTLAP